MEILKVKYLSVKFGNKYILKDVSFSLLKGEKFFILGSNGAGKTTLIETIMGFIKPESGEIYFLGKKMEKEEDFYELRKNIGYVFQNPDDQLFSPTVEEELAFGPLNLKINRIEIKKRIEKVLNEFGISHLRNRYIHLLSGGEKRIVSIACVLTMEPMALIMDEPSAGLDEMHFNYLIEFLKNTNKSVIIATHDKDLISVLKWKIYKLENGYLTLL